MSDALLKKLRRRFMALSMLSLVVSMFIIAALLYTGSAVLSRRSINNTLDYIIENEGILDEENFLPASSNKATRFLDEIFYTSPERQSPELQYMIRYFVIQFDEEKNIEGIITNHISAVSEEEAELYGQKALRMNRITGRFDNYYYKVSYNEDGSGILVYLDGHSINATNYRILYLSLILVAVGTIISFFVARKFSSWALKGEVRNAKVQKQFMTDISHELKTPLAVIRANTEMQEIMSGENEWTESTLRQVDRMNGLIANLVTIAKAEERELEDMDKEVNITEVIHDTVNNFNSLSISTGKSLIENLEPNISMKADEANIRQLCSLLVDNALKYCDDEGKIAIDLSTHGKYVHLNVSNDYAEGKDVDYTKFFQRFYRQDSSHNIDKGGYGIGLSVAESIVRRYNGSIDVSWKNGVITFSCSLKK